MTTTTMAAGETSKLDIFSDESCLEYMKSDFSVKSHASQLLQGVAVSQHLSKLSTQLDLIDENIQREVTEHYEDLLGQALGMEKLEQALETMQSHTQSLMASVERLRSKVSEPHSKLKNQTMMLARLQSTCEILRRIIRILSLSKRLQTQLQAGTKEITKTAQTLSELDHLTKDMDLSGIEIIEKDHKMIIQARAEIEKKAEVLLQQGLEAQNQAQVGTALQVFHNLGNLQFIVERVLEQSRENLRRCVKRALDMEQLVQAQSAQNINEPRSKGPGRAMMPSTGNSPAFRAALWANMEKLMDQIFSYCSQVQHLQKVLAKKRDPVTHVCFLEELNQSKNSHLVQRYWTKVTQLLTEQFNQAANESSFIKQAFEGEFPKLLRLSCELWAKLQQFSDELSAANHLSSALERDLSLEDDSSVGNAEEPAAVPQTFNAENALRKTLDPFQNAYLSRSLSRLFDPVNLMFSGTTDTLPSTDEFDNLIKVIQNELMVSLVDPKLCSLVAKNVIKTIQLISVKAEQLVVAGGEASQVIGPPTEAQKTNAGLVNLLHYFERNVRRTVSVIPGLGNQISGTILDSLSSAADVMRNAVEPLLSSLADAVEAILLTIHQEDFSSNQIPAEGSAPCSLYMKELQGFLTRAAADYIALYQCHEFMQQQIRPVATRCLELFVRHASLVRPLGEGGKMRLAADFAQMELAISSLYERPTELGKWYRVLRSFRPLLFQTIEHLSASPAVGDIVPYSVVLHFLFARAPAEFKSPQQAAGWSISRYSQWLDEHASERDRLSLIQGALESYVQSVKQRQAKEFAPVYSVMLQLMQKALLAH